MNIKVQNCINGYRHQDYEHVVELYEFYETILTGDDYGDLIKEYKGKETPAQKEQRVLITTIRTKAIAGKIEGFFKRPYRVDKIQLRATHEDSTKAALIAAHINDYGNDGETTLSYCEETALFLNGIDPNAFYWVKHTIEDGKDSFEPIIFGSESVLDFEVKKGQLTYAVTVLEESVTVGTGKDQKTKTITIYYYFSKEGIEINVFVDSDVVTKSTYYDKYFAANSSGKDNVQKFKVGDKEYYNILILDDKLDTSKLPISRVGYAKDKCTDGRTYVSYWDNASELYRSLANDGSEFDITKIAHVFMQKYEYEKTCDYQDGATKATCVNGTMRPSGATCPNCNGTGGTTIISGQDVIKIRLPRVEEGENLVLKPSDMVHYVQLPFDIVNFQQELVNSYPAKIAEAIFGVDLDEKPNVAMTATENTNSIDLAQDIIYEYTKAPKRMFLFTIQTQANYLKIENPDVAIEYSNEYNLQSEEFLLKLLKDAKDAGAYPEIIENITKRLALKQNRSDSGYMAIWEKMRQFMPFSGVDNETRQALILALPPTDPQRVLAINFKQITDKIISEKKGFSLLSYEKQKELIESETQKYVDAAIAANAIETMSNLSTNIPAV